MSPSLISLGTTALALRLHALRGTTAYVACLARPEQVAGIIGDLRSDLYAYLDDDDAMTVDVMSASPGAPSLLDTRIPDADILLLDASAYSEADWRMLDLRRSEFARKGITAFFTTSNSFDCIMHVAPNIASWLGGNVFRHDSGDAFAASRHEHAISALREWSGKTDEEVIEAATNRCLPRPGVRRMAHAARQRRPPGCLTATTSQTSKLTRQHVPSPWVSEHEVFIKA